MSEVGHKCHARDCGVAVPPEMLMCRRHWRMVPRKVQLAVWRHFRPGQEVEKDPSEAWHRAADAAIGFVAKSERRGYSEDQRAAMVYYGLLPANPGDSVAPDGGGTAA